MDRVTEDDGTVKLPFENGQKCEGVDTRCLAHQAGGNGQTKQSVGHGPAEGVALGRRMINMQRIEVARQAGEENNIGFRDGSPWALPLVTDRRDHRMSRLTMGGASRPSISSVLITFRAAAAIRSSHHGSVTIFRHSDFARRNRQDHSTVRAIMISRCSKQLMLWLPSVSLQRIGQFRLIAR